MMEPPSREPSFVPHPSRQRRVGLTLQHQFASRPRQFVADSRWSMPRSSIGLLGQPITIVTTTQRHRDSTSGRSIDEEASSSRGLELTRIFFGTRRQIAIRMIMPSEPDGPSLCTWVARTFSRMCNVESVLRALVPAESKISEHILYPLSRILLNLHVRTLRISEPHFALPRQQQIPISS